MGGQEKTFQNETEYLQFLQKDSQSSLLWMDHGDLQAVSNHYKVKIHILSTNIEGMEEPKARWTHLEPDERLKEFSSLPNGLQDLWLMHIDRYHFDLIIEKESILAKEGIIIILTNNSVLWWKRGISDKLFLPQGTRGTWQFDDVGYVSRSEPYNLRVIVRKIVWWVVITLKLPLYNK